MAEPGETLYINVPKLGEHRTRFTWFLTSTFQAATKTTFLSRMFLECWLTNSLVDKLVVKFGDTIFQQAVGYDIYKIFEDLFLSEETCQDMLMEGIQSEDLCKICSNAGDKKTLGVDAENKLAKV